MTARGVTYGRNIGMDLGSTDAVSPAATVGVVPYIGWQHYEGPEEGVPDFGPVQLVDDQGTTLSTTAQAINLGSNRLGRSADDGSNDWDLFRKLVRGREVSGSTADVAFVGIPYSKYDVFVIVETSASSAEDYIGAMIAGDLSSLRVAKTDVSGNWAGSYVEATSSAIESPTVGANYVRFEGLEQADLTLSIVSESIFAGGCAAIQIVERTDLPLISTASALTDTAVDALRNSTKLAGSACATPAEWSSSDVPRVVPRGTIGAVNRGRMPMMTVHVDTSTYDGIVPGNGGGVNSTVLLEVHIAGRESRDIRDQANAMMVNALAALRATDHFAQGQDDALPEERGVDWYMLSAQLRVENSYDETYEG